MADYLVCPRCGSDHWETITASKYLQNGTRPGYHLMATSPRPVSVLRCVACLHVYNEGNGFSLNVPQTNLSSYIPEPSPPAPVAAPVQETSRQKKKVTVIEPAPSPEEKS